MSLADPNDKTTKVNSTNFNATSPLHSIIRISLNDLISTTYRAEKSCVTGRSTSLGAGMHITSLTPEINPSAQSYLTRFLLEIFLLEPCISLIHA
jgi:hypothetical protein